MTAASDPVLERDDTPAIELVEVTKRYGEVIALSSLSLEVVDGEMLVLLGPSGCGKSTILKIISGLEGATEGDVYIKGRLASYTRPRERDVAMVFQNYALYPHMRIRDNIGFPLRVRGMDRSDIYAQVAKVARQLELERQLEKYPEQLSGGQRQRVALGRAIVRDPVAFLMDEPLSNLDALLRVQMRTELLELHRRLGRTTVYVTHDQVEAMTMATRIVVMDLGVVQQIGSPMEVYARPANTFVAAFVGSPQMNLLTGEMSRAGGAARFDGAVSVELGDRPLPAGPATIGIRPEDVAVVRSDEATIAGRVEIVEPIGSDTYLKVRLAAGIPMTARVRPDTAWREGDQVGLRLPIDALHLFDGDGRRLPAEPVPHEPVTAPAPMKEAHEQIAVTTSPSTGWATEEE
jgi:ABC-type sugar transport system ATPase subunit